MQCLLVNPPSLFTARQMGVAGRQSYFDIERRMAGSQSAFSTLPGEHLGLMSIKAACDAQNIPARVVNGQVLGHVSLEETFRAMQTAVAAGGTPILMGFSGPSLVFRENEWLALRAKEAWPGAMVILGHDFATLNCRTILAGSPVFDCVCLGEGEAVFPALALALSRRTPLADIAGLAWREADGAVAVNDPGAPLELDTLAWPARDDLARVLALGLSASLFTSRGCPYRCTFCTTGQTARLTSPRRPYRTKSVDGVVEEMEGLARRFGVRRVTIVDDVFLTAQDSSKARAVALADSLLARRLGLGFMCDCRADALDLDILAHLKQAGLQRLFVGFESGSAGQLAFYDKRIPADIASQLQGVRDLGLEIIPGIITYHPALEPQEARETLGIIDASGYTGTYPFLNRIVVHPGTRLFEQYDALGYLTEGFPVPQWAFVDPRAQAFQDAMMRAGDSLGFADLRREFLRELQRWERARERT